MKIVNEPKVELLNQLNHQDNELIFYDDICKIYLSYRQCYTNDPTLDGLLTPDNTSLPKLDAYIGQTSLDAGSMDDFGKTLFYKNFEEQHPDENIFMYYDPYKLLNLIKMCKFILKHNNHESPQEHGSVTFRVSDVSRNFSHQFVRHRLASYSQASQRYINIDEPTVIIPPSISRDETAKQLFLDAIYNIQQTCKELKNIIGLNIKNEDLRFLYPSAYATEIVATMNFRELKHFWNERCCTRAQWEIRSVANKLLKMMQSHVPYIFDRCGPKCLLFRSCPEHSDKCKRYKMYW